jgi:2-keto-4-pentenoate hydratase
MVGLSPAGETAILTPLTTTAYVSLHTADPGTTGTSEVSGGAYARQGPIAFTNAGSEPTVASNSAILTFPAATAAWGTISYFGIWTALTGGTFQGSGALTTPKPVNSGDTVRFSAGALTITAQ